MKTLQQRAQDALEAQRTAEKDYFAAKLEKNINEARGNLQGLLYRVLNVRPDLSQISVLLPENASRPEALAEVDGLLLAARWVSTRITDSTRREGYVLQLVHECRQCSGLVYDRQIESLLDLGLALENPARESRSCLRCSDED